MKVHMCHGLQFFPYVPNDIDSFLNAPPHCPAPISPFPPLSLFSFSHPSNIVVHVPMTIQTGYAAPTPPWKPMILLSSTTCTRTQES